MKKSFWMFTLVLVVAVVLIEFDLARRTAVQTIAQSKKRNPPAVAKTTGLKVEDSFDQKFNNLSKVSLSNLSQPDESEQKIIDLAKSLSGDDLKHLAHVMVDKNATEGQRALAVQLVSRNQTVDSLKELENFVLAKRTNLSFKKGDEIVSALKAQAIEGIAAFPQKDLAISALTSLNPKVEELFLKDRIKRSVADLQNQVENSETTDASELQKLVE